MTINISRSFLLIALVAISEINASELIINLSNQEQAGTLMLAIYQNAESFQGSVKNEKRSETGVFKGLELYLEPEDVTRLSTEIPNGFYAIALFIDVNGNKKLDKNFLGIPKEQFGFSNNAMGTLAAPTFNQAKFNIEGRAVQNIKLK
jgi:uncharacterized protein (DUF2141 family)